MTVALSYLKGPNIPERLESLSFIPLIKALERFFRVGRVFVNMS
jgi:hypothetical protein